MTMRGAGAGAGPRAGEDISKLSKAVHSFVGGNQTAFVVSAPGKVNSPVDDQLDFRSPALVPPKGGG